MRKRVSKNPMQINTQSEAENQEQKHLIRVHAFIKCINLSENSKFFTHSKISSCKGRDSI